MTRRGEAAGTGSTWRYAGRGVALHTRIEDTLSGSTDKGNTGSHWSERQSGIGSGSGGAVFLAKQIKLAFWAAFQVQRADRFNFCAHT